MKQCSICQLITEKTIVHQLFIVMKSRVMADDGI